MNARWYERWGARLSIWTLRLSVVLLPLAILPDSLSAPKVVVLMVACVMLGIGCLLCGRPISPGRVPFFWPLVAYAILQTVQVSRSLNLDHAWAMLILQLGGAFIGLAVAWTTDDRDVISLLRFTALGALMVSVLGILEYWGVSWAMWPSAGRPSATLGFRNIAGMYLAICLPLSGALVLQARRKDAWLGVSATIAMAVFLIFTRTRGAWLGVMVACFAGVVAAWRVRRPDGHTLFAEVQGRLRKRLPLFLIGGVACLAALFMPPKFRDSSPSRLDEKKVQVASTVTSIVQPGGDRGRLRIWRHTFAMIADHPLFGVGLDNWAALYPKYDGGDVLGIEVAPKRPHNDWLWIWSELGTVGLAAYLWLLWVVFRQIWARLHTECETALPALCIGMGLIGLLVHSCVSFPREQATVALLFWVALGLSGRGRDTAVSPKRFGWLCGLLGVAVGGFGCWIGVAGVRFDRHFARAQAAHASGNAMLQVAEARRACAYGIFDSRVLLLEGLGQTALGDYAAAIKTYRDYLRYQPYLPALHNNLGRAYAGVGDYASAEKAYLAGVKTFSGSGRGVLLNNLAAAYKKQGRTDEALKVYEQATDLPAEGYHNLGLIYAERGAYDRALQAYRQALVRAPDMTIVYFSMAGVQMLSGDYEGAVAGYETFLGRWSGAPDYVRDARLRLRQLYPVLGDRYLKSGRWDEAARVYERLLNLGVETPQVYADLTMIYGRSGKFAASLDAGRKALALDAGFAPAHFALATVYDQMGDRAEALEHYRRFVALQKGDDPLVVRARQRISALQRR